MKQIIFLTLIALLGTSSNILAQGSQGGGLYLDNGKLENTLVKGNKSKGDGTGVYANESSSITNATIVENNSGVDLSIGESYGGGLVFYKDEKTRTAYIVSMEESDEKWGKYGVINSRSGDYSDGKKNTEALVDSQVIIPQIDYKFNNGGTATIAADTLQYAVQWCVKQNEGGFSDWFLPAREQLKQLYVAKPLINATLSGLGKTLLGNTYYWSSTEDDAYNAWYVFFDTGEVNTGEKSNVGRVRAIRAVGY